jgi:ATP-binding cassette subfamily B protein
MVEIFETPIDITDPEKPEKCLIKDGNIVFDNISFEYKDGKDVFKKFKLEIPAGQKVGFVGHSGSGKTTITNLLLRFEDVQAGAIKIDGQDIRNITQDDLRRNISYVPQEPALFHRTLQENIMYGNPKASKLAVLEASKKAHADEFIKEFKEGYETLVGERGVKLSGGQRQRVAIARVMLEDAPILILDEATSSLDSISENLIQKAFDEVMKDRTTLVIAHRLSTVQKMDRIIVLEKGKIVEDGGHEELLAKEGYYFKLWQAQKDGVI